MRGPAMNPCSTVENNRLRYEQLLHEASVQAPRSGRREPRRSRRGRHRI